ncbi:MAG: hypothetical protein KF797_09480 [Flavobacteriales bacterium]|nr:hypothetical protein [Flavobacteriales bacterium]
MSRTRITEVAPRRRRMPRIPEELLVPKRVRRGRKADTIQLQWYDGAGELQYEELSPAQSWPYLSRN